MYKVFIENTPLYFTESIKDLPKQVFCLFDLPSNSLLKEIEKIYKKKDNHFFIAIISKNPKESMLKTFDKYKFIEAAGGIVKNLQNKKLLFIKRDGFWDIPKGKLEKKESIKKAAQREIEEECGINNIVLKKPICATFHTYKRNGKKVLKKTHWYSFEYAGNQKLKPQQEEGITKVKWFKNNNLDKIEKNTFNTILEVIESYKLNY